MDTNLFLLMLIILNPFSQVLYLRELFETMHFKRFTRVHLRASFYSFIIFVVFAISASRSLMYFRSGRSLRVFGGLINLSSPLPLHHGGGGQHQLFRRKFATWPPKSPCPHGGSWQALSASSLARSTAPSSGRAPSRACFSSTSPALCAYGVFGTPRAPEPPSRSTSPCSCALWPSSWGPSAWEMIVGGLQELLAEARPARPCRAAPSLPLRSARAFTARHMWAGIRSGERASFFGLIRSRNSGRSAPAACAPPSFARARGPFPHARAALNQAADTASG